MQYLDIYMEFIFSYYFNMPVERVIVLEEPSPWKEEHMARYLWASRYVAGMNLLDIACGSGFGSKILLENGAGKVHSADQSDEAHKITSSLLTEYNDRAYVEIQNAQEMSYPEKKFDAVVSVETIEHLPEPEKFLQEIKRVLKPGGVLIITTPNALVTKPVDNKPTNPFHQVEFTPEEFKKILGKYFDVEFSCGQHLDLKNTTAPFLTSFDRSKLNFLQVFHFTVWRILLRVPALFRNKIHRLFFRRNFYPTIYEYIFLPENLDIAHVQCHVCRKSKDVS